MSAIVSRCCCGDVVCDSDDFDCSQATGRCIWNFEYKYVHTSSITADFEACYELDDSYANCDQPDAEGPVPCADQTAAWSGTGFRMYVTGFDNPKTGDNVENILDMPQSISVSDPPTDAELCNLAQWSNASSAGTCTPVAPTVQVAMDMNFVNVQQFRSSPASTLTWPTNSKCELAMEARLTSNPACTFAATLRKRVPAHYACPGTYICSTTACYLDAVYDIACANKLEFRCTGTLREYASTDLNQTGTPTNTYTASGEWNAVTVDLQMRQLYEGMYACDDPSRPIVVKPMRPNNAFEAPSGFANDVRRAMALSVNFALAELGGSVMGAQIRAGVAPDKSGANNQDLRMRVKTSGFFPSQDEENIGGVDEDIGSFDAVDGCAIFNHYTSATNTHSRSVEVDVDYTYTDCAACADRTNEGNASVQLDYAFYATPNLISLAAEDCT